MKVLKKKELFNKYLIDVIVLLILFSSCSSTIITGKYPYTKRLNNGNYVIASSRNITFTDSSLSTSLNSLNFDSDIIKSEDNGLGSTSIAQFPAEQNGYVLVILNKILFVFSSTGVHLVNQNTTIKNTKFPAYLITNGNSGSNYYFTLIYCDHETDPTSEECTYIAFIKYTYNSSTKSLTSEKKDYDPPINTFFGTISCNQMSNSSIDYIACAYGEYQHIYVSVFDPNDNYNLVYSTDKALYSQFVKATVLLPERNNLLICSYAQGNGNLNCFYYNIGDNSLSSDPLQLENTCGGQPISLTIEYFYETESFIVGCKLDGNTLTLNEISKELTLKTNFGTTYDNTNLFSGAEDVGRISIIFPQGGNQFTVYYNMGQSCNSNCPENVMTRIGNEISSSNLHPYPTTEVSPLVCDAYYSYDGKTCINDIPEGFYCNSTNDKTIDKCHDNCKSCTTGPTSTNNSCTTCKDTVTIYYDLGNCVSECTNGHFTENSIMKCKCSSDISCEYCSVESKAQNLCVTCNTNYYPKKEDPENRDSFIKCYNDSTISSGYYLNTNIYEPCHTNCLKCSGAGTDNDNKCTICNDGLTLIKNKLNIINCYTTCTNYYYFDNGNNYHCTTELKCPDNYKLINVKGKCIDNCEYDDTYKFEYNGDCYNECPPNTINSSSNTYICELNCKHFNKYFNLERTACIQNIEEGYYCDNEDLNTIAQCHTNCKTCTKGPTDSNNNCETCKETGTIYFDLGNCRDNCKNGDFTENGIKKCKCTSDEKCYYCSDESKALGLCESCNTESG